MNGLSLRISTGAKKCKNIMVLPPVVITNFPADNASVENKLVKSFLQAETADEQLGMLKKMLDTEAGPVDLNIMRLLVVVFFHSEAKHPVKCFITRHITKSNHHQAPFIELLSTEITIHLKNDNYKYKTYKDTVPKIGMCLENFPPGTCAVEDVKKYLAPYLANCLYSCIDTVRIDNPSPTTKNEVYSLAHLTLRLLLHIITKHQQIHEPEGDDPHKVSQWLFDHSSLMESIDLLLRDKDVPMDTKSVCGLVAMSMCTYRYSDGPYCDAWENFMYSKENAEMTDDVQLAMYSAIITTVPMRRLQETHSLDNPAPIVIIVKTFMDIVERCSSDGVLILGVTRTLLQVSKGLSELKVELGVQMTEQLLSFVWIHLEHYMDSVRHLTAQILASAVHYCAALEINELDREALGRALAALAALGVRRRGFHAGARGCARALTAGRVLRDVAPLPRLLPALMAPHVATTTAATLDDLLVRHSQETETSVIHEQWVVPIIQFVQTNDLETEVLTILENLLAKAVKLDQKLVTFILPHIKQACETPDRDLKNVLVLLSVARASLAKLTGDNTADQQELWGGVLPYEVLDEAVVDARDEVRLAALRLACAGAGGTGGVGGGELEAVRGYLLHAAREAPHCRQRARPLLYKFIKRLFDGIRAAKRSGDEERSLVQYGFLEELRQICYCSLQRGSHERRSTALQLLQAVEPGPLPYERTWKLDYVEMLLVHLEDSYETNKALALEILQHVPLELLKEASSVSLRLDDIISQAAALKPTECVSAAYKLELLWRRLPDRILQGKTCEAAEPALFCVMSALLARASAHYDVLHAARDAPTYGLLHCAARLIDLLDPRAIEKCQEWQILIKRIIDVCQSLIDRTGAVVNHAAPEGMMPSNCQYSDYGNNAGVTLADGRLVTAQMVLLCAWRTHKEATSVLGGIGARCLIGTVGSISLQQLALTLSSALSTARHRGAFEQAYVAYERVLHRMWRDSDAGVSGWAARQLAQTRAQLRGGAGARAAHRRSAGLPFQVQALVSTEVGAGGPGTGLRDVMTELLRLAEGAESGEGAETDAEAAANHRAHAFNVLRALYRDSSLEAAVQGYVGEGLRVALKGFEGATWAERNSSTLLLSALVTRVFGVWRARARLSARNRMTGRVFYLRYPQLYDIMLNKLKEVSESEEKQLLCPSLYPVLLLLARLYPSSLEGTESNLKLVSFVPHVVACARSRVLHTRRLAAAAGVALIAPDRYVEHLQYLLGLVSEPRIERNFCHGVLLQICALLENKPEGVECSELAQAVPGTLWQLAQPCGPVLQQHALLLAALLSRFPETLVQETRDAIEARLRAVLFEPLVSAIACGRALCLAACLRLLLRLAADVTDLVLRALQHDVHEVCGAALDYLLELHGRGAGQRQEGEGQRQEGEGQRQEGEGHAVLAALRLRDEYLPLLAAPLQQQDIWRCEPQRPLKHLEVLVAEGGTQKLVMSVAPHFLVECSDDVILGLRQLIDSAPDNMKHLFLESLTSYVSERLGQTSRPELSVSELVCASESIRSCACAESRAARAQAARALRQLAADMLQRVDARAGDQALFELESNLFSSVAELLRDCEPELRAQASAAALRLAGQSRGSAVEGRAAALLLRAGSLRPRAAPLLTALALSAAPAPVLEDSDADECRVFEPRQAARGEEARWAGACAGKIVDLCALEGVDPLAHVAQLLDRWSFSFVDQHSIDAVKAAAGGTAVLDPIVELFVKTLKREI